MSLYRRVKYHPSKMIFSIYLWFAPYNSSYDVLTYLRMIQEYFLTHFYNKLTNIKTTIIVIVVRLNKLTERKLSLDAQRHLNVAKLT